MEQRRRWILLVLAVSSAAFLTLLLAPPSPAQTPKTLRIKPTASGFGVVDLATKSYVDAERDLRTLSDITIPLQIAGLPATGLEVANVEMGSDDGTQNNQAGDPPSLALHGTASVLGASRHVLLSAVWSRGRAGTPDLALAVKATSAKLSSLNSSWDGAIDPTFSDAWLVVTPSSTAITLDPAKLPATPSSVAGFYGSSPAPMSLNAAVVSFRGDAATAGNTAMEHVKKFLGVTSPIRFEGRLANSVSALFPLPPNADLAAVELQTGSLGPTATLPAWMTNRSSTVKLTTSGDAADLVRFTDTFTLAAGSTTNQFEAANVNVSPASFSGAPVTVGYKLLGSFGAPFGAGWLDLSDVGLDVSLSTEGSYTGRIGAKLQIPSGAKVGLAVDLQAGDQRVTGTFRLTEPVAVADIVKLVGGLVDTAAFTADLGNLSLRNVTFSFSRTQGSEGFSLSALSTIRNLEVDVLVSARKTTDGPVLLVGAHPRSAVTLGNVLGATLPYPIADLTLGTPNLTVVQGTTSLAAASLTAAEKAYFEQVYGASKLLDPLTFADGLNLTATVPLDPLGAGVRQALGYAEKSQVVLQGTLGFTLGAFGGSSPLGLTGVSLSATLPSLTPDFPAWMPLQSAQPSTFGVSYNSVSRALEMKATSVVDVTLGSTTFDDVAVTSTFTRTAAGAGGTPPAATVQSLTATLGVMNDPFGQTWLDLDSAGLSATITVPDTGRKVFAARVLAAVTLEGLGSFSVEIAGMSGDGKSARVTASTALGLSLGKFADHFAGFAQSQFGVTGLGSAVPSELRSLTLDKAKISAAGPTDKTFTITATTSFTPASTPLSAHARIVIAPGRLLVGLSRPDTNTSLSQVVSGLPRDVDFTLPAFGVALAKPAMEKTTFPNLTADEFEFFKTFYGCAADYATRATCLDEVSVAEGVTMIASAQLPDGLKPVVKQVGVREDRPLLVRGTIPVFGGNGNFSLRAQLPPIEVPANDFVKSASLFLDVSPEGLSMGGGLGLQLRHGEQSVASDTLCPAPTVALVSVADNKKYCYDVLTFQIAASVKLNPPGVEFTGSLQTAGGWKAPFGIPWLEINNATLKLGVTANPSPAVTLGFGGAVKLGSKDIDAAMLLDVNLATAIPVPSIQGVRAASTAGLSLSDLASLAGAVSGTTISTSDLGLPNIAVRNLKFAFSRVEDKDLCLTPGIRFGGDVYVNASNTVSDDHTANVAAIGKCLQLPVEKVDAPTDDCKKNKDNGNGCFASVLSRVDQNGLSAAGFIGGFSLSPFKWDNAKAVLELSANRQRIGVSGGMHIGADGVKFADGTVDLDFQSTGMSFKGDVQLFGGTFAAYLYGSGSGFSLTSPPSFDGTLVLRSDFSSAVSAALAPTLQTLRSGVLVLNNVFQALQDPNRAFQTLRTLPATLATLGVETPQWLKDFVNQAATIDANISKYGTGSNGLGTVLSGITFASFAGIPGEFVPPEPTCSGFWDGPNCYIAPSVCVTIPFHGEECTPPVPGVVAYPTCPFPGTVHNGTCYVVPPLPSISIGGICGRIGLNGCDLQALLSQKINPLIAEAIRKVTGLNSSVTFDVATFLQNLSTKFGGTDVLSVKCAQFTGKLGNLATNPGTAVSVAMKLGLFGTDVSFGVTWDFKASNIADNAGRSAISIVSQVLSPSPVACAGLPAGVGSDAPAGGGTPGSGSTPATIDLSISLDKTRVTENDEVQLKGRFTDTVTSARAVTVDWGDGSAIQTVTTSAAEFTVSHQYLDNKPEGLPSANYAVTATAEADLKIPKRTTVVTVDNAAPKDIALVLGADAPKEGDEVTLSGSFADAGTQDVHKVEIDWGDGTAKSVTNVTGGRTFAPKHSYADNGTYTLSAVVTDEDGGFGTKTLSVVVTNVAPSAVALAPCRLVHTGEGDCTPNLALVEGDVVRFTGSFVDPGSADSHKIVIDWGDGTPASILNLGGFRTFSATHRYLDNAPKGRPAGDVPLKVTVTDDDRGEGSVATGVRVANVAPGTLHSILQPLPIAEAGTVTLGGAFSDPGTLDRHRVTIDWGEGWPVAERTESLTLPPGARLFRTSRQFGDNGTFQVKITVIDDDAGQGDTTRGATVVNVRPTSVVDDAPGAGTVTAGGAPTFIARAGETLTFRGTVTDAGSDDVTARWDWADGNLTSTPFLANGPDTDPLPSPQIGPRNVRDEQPHAWRHACLYQPTFSAADDDGGASTPDAFKVVMRGTATGAEPAGYWQTQYGTARVGGALPPELLACYLRIAGHMSTVFDETRDASTPERAFDVLNPAASRPARDLLDRELLAAWLNFAHGVFDLDQLLDTDGDRLGDIAFWAVMAEAESVRNDGTSTKKDFEAETSILRRLNTPPQP